MTFLGILIWLVRAKRREAMIFTIAINQRPPATHAFPTFGTSALWWRLVLFFFLNYLTVKAVFFFWTFMMKTQWRPEIFGQFSMTWMDLYEVNTCGELDSGIYPKDGRNGGFPHWKVGWSHWLWDSAMNPVQFVGWTWTSFGIVIWGIIWLVVSNIFYFP